MSHAEQHSQAQHVQCLCSKCLRPVVVLRDPNADADPRENGCPHCRADVCGCATCLSVLNALRAGCRDWQTIGLRRPIVSWSEAEGIELVPPNTTFH